MLRCKDEFGTVVPGLMRSGNGALVSSDEVEFNKYKRQKHLIASQENQIAALSSEVHQLKQLVMQMLTNREI